MFDTALVMQIKEWREAGKQVVLLMDVNDNPLHNPLYKKLKQMGTEMQEFTHKCWGSKAPHTHARGTRTIDGGYKSPEVEIMNISMRTFTKSPGDHRSIMLDITSRSLLRKFTPKIIRPVRRRLVNLQPKAVRTINRITHKQFRIHMIAKQMDTVDKLTQECGYPAPKWLRTKILQLYNQITEIKLHAETNCRKIRTPDSKFSPAVKMWYDHIHSYLQLIWMREGKIKNKRNVLQFARRNQILEAEKLRMEEMKDGLQLVRLRKTDLRKEAAGLRQAHLRECLLEAQLKKDKERANAIKQRIHRKGSKRTWFVACCKSHDPTRGQGVGSVFSTYLLPTN